MSNLQDKQPNVAHGDREAPENVSDPSSKVIYKYTHGNNGEVKNIDASKTSQQKAAEHSNAEG